MGISSRQDTELALANRDRLRAALATGGQIAPAILDEAERLSAADPVRALEMLLRLGACTDAQLTQRLAEAYGLPLADPRLVASAIEFGRSVCSNVGEKTIAHQRIARVDRNYWRLHRCAFVSHDSADRRGSMLLVDHPFDSERTAALSFVVGGEVSQSLVSRAQLESVLKEYDDKTTANSDPVADDVLRLESLDRSLLITSDTSSDASSDAPAIRYVQQLISDAMARGASDIHVEPMEHQTSVRVRIDGVLRDVAPPAEGLADAIVSRMKILASLDIAERRLPQDGRIRLRVGGALTDFRVSTSPTMFGESVVLRILDRRHLTLEFSALGVAPDYVGTLERALSRPYGIVLVTGPTGSGKTTTLYAALKLLNQRDRKILTVEDPVEYTLEGVNQTQVKPAIGYHFANALRAFLRQDPDVLMVGEIRDRETAQVAIQAAQTGHILLSTLHTNTAAAAITRLLDMEVEDYLLTSTLALVVGQRLVRTLCDHCKVATPLLPELRARFPGLASIDTVYQPRGCAACNGSGYAGRTVIAELLEMDSALQSEVLKRSDAQTLERAAVERGMRTMLADGLRVVTEGRTTLDEVLRVTRAV